jgi:hypothetical protein
MRGAHTGEVESFTQWWMRTVFWPLLRGDTTEDMTAARHAPKHKRNGGDDDGEDRS